MSLDSHPIYDQIPGTRGLYVAARFSGHGFMMAPSTRKSMAEMILGLTPTLPWDKLGFARFDKGELLVEPSGVEGRLRHIPSYFDFTVRVKYESDL